MKKKLLNSKLLIIFAALVSLFCFVTFSLAAAADRDHECMGEECMICTLSSVNESIFSFTAAMLSCVVFCGAFAILFNFGAYVYETKIARFTPVFLKVKLLD